MARVEGSGTGVNVVLDEKLISPAPSPRVSTSCSVIEKGEANEVIDAKASLANDPDEVPVMLGVWGPGVVPVTPFWLLS